ncbi:MAG: histidinol-phosphate transaminase [Clostridia bacterium]|nr:histidinol-phosphate transaminase [Clostridia bacterium]
MSRFFSEKLSSLEPYTPGEQPRDMVYIKLNTNESPYPPSPKALAVIEGEATRLNLYSDPTARALHEAIAAHYSITADRVIASNGSDEILAFAFDAFANGKSLAFPDVTYGFYPVFANLFGIPYTTVPLDETFTIRVEDYAHIDSTVVIANPNAKTGTYLPLSKIEELVVQNRDRVVIVDEAYIDFGGESAIPLTDRYDNLLVVQTFSKSRNLAGARVGFAVGCAELIADLNRVKYSFNPYNVNRLSMAAAAQAMKDEAYFDECTGKIIETRSFIAEALTKLGFTYPASKANFILAHSDKIGGKELYQKLKAKGVLVRHLSDQRITDSIRITIGTKEQMETLIQKIQEILEDLT